MSERHNEKFWNRIIYCFVALAVCVGFTKGVVSIRDPIKYDEGYEAGYEAGHYDGYEDACSQAYNDGYAAGYQDGSNDGYDEGYDSGHNEGYREGHYDGEEEGREAGYRSAVDDLESGEISQEYFPGYTPDYPSTDTSKSYSSTGAGTKTTPTNTQQPADPAQSRIVYVSRKGKIHSIPNCSGMKYYTEMTYQAAVNAGYVFCENCF